MPSDNHAVALALDIAHKALDIMLILASAPDAIELANAQKALTGIQADAAQLILPLARLRADAERREEAAEAALDAGAPARTALAARVMQELATADHGAGEIAKAERKLVADLGEVVA